MHKLWVCHTMWKTWGFCPPSLPYWASKPTESGLCWVALMVGGFWQTWLLVNKLSRRPRWLQLTRNKLSRGELELWAIIRLWWHLKRLKRGRLATGGAHWPSSWHQPGVQPDNFQIFLFIWPINNSEHQPGVQARKFCFVFLPTKSYGHQPGCTGQIFFYVDHQLL